ncbi:pentapeptide repeat-containing protein [Streptomyces sp. SID5926]|nr:pentapeptide repeat-containing protein [Streptomyces sp. SID5926]
MSDLSPSLEPPDWDHCGVGASPATTPVGCRGIRVAGYNECFAHLDAGDRAGFLTTLSPGADVDVRGVTFTEALLNELVGALRPSGSSKAHFGEGLFNEARFTGRVHLWATFDGQADFSDAQFLTSCEMGSVTFNGSAIFTRAVFNFASFAGTNFNALASFDFASFERVSFVGAIFDGSARAYFRGTKFDAWNFQGVQFGSRVKFNTAQFTSTHPQRLEIFGLGSVIFDRAQFAGPMTVAISAREVSFSGARFDGPVTMHLHYADADLSEMQLSFPTSIASVQSLPRQPTQLEARLAANGRRPRASLMSLSGVDASLLMLRDIDLGRCRFAGAHRLDQLTFDGDCSFGRTPRRMVWRTGFPFWWGNRQTLIEEQYWRSLETHTWALRAGWHYDNPFASDEFPSLPNPDPAGLAVLYRKLRKAFEEAKNEPGAADFYYGEMEMRRHSRRWSEGERWLLQAYWLVSGYGLRTWRALSWLATSMLITVVLMMGFGLPQESPKQVATGTVPPGGGKVTFEIDKGDPKNPTGNRFTGKRFDKALNVTLNSVVFRSSGQDLTTAGGYIEMASRFSEPILLALAALALRGRVKR